MIRPIAIAAALAWGSVAVAAPVTLPGLSYEVQASGPAGGLHPTRADSVTMRYVGRLSDGTVFSTSPDDGKGLSTFAVKEVIPGMSAVLQLMRPGDRWRVTMPPYLAYGPGRPYTPPAAGAPAQAIQKQGIPPNATLIFDVELVGIVLPKAN
jgi:FKBP-type peptidyl-prolyl cis-trans isomerase